MKTIIILLVSFVFTACSVSHVDRYPGVSVPAFPEELWGEYRLSPGMFRSLFAGKQLDSARVRVLPNRTETLNPGGWTSDFTIDSNNVLSQVSTYYFLSQRDVDEPLFWNTSVLWKNNNEIYIASINATDKNLQSDKLKNYLSLSLVVRKNQKETVLKVDTRDKVLLKKLSAVELGNKDSVLFYRMEEAQLLRYIKKEISSKNALKFVRIKSPEKK